jgi:hypothetical protein
MNMEAQRSERGQALVIIILAIVGIMGFAALAVDGGQMYAERRSAQNAADAAAYAAAFMKTNDKNANFAALEDIVLKKAKDNGFIPDAGKEIEVEYHNPPTSGPYTGKTEYHQVIIRSKVDQVFSQFVFNGKQKLQVEAVSRGRPTQAIFPGNAVHATNESDCEAIWFAGGGQTSVTGGNIFSNSNANASNCSSGLQNGSGGVQVQGGHGIHVVGGWVTKGGSGLVSPSPTTNVDAQPMPNVPLPDCSHLPSRGSIKHNDKDTVTIQPGNYGTIDVQGGKLIMAPGMYCLSGDFETGGNGELEGNGVFIVMWNGAVKWNGGGVINLKRANYLEDGSGQNWGGMLLYMPMGNKSEIKIAGGAGSNFSGTILAPDETKNKNAKCDLTGNSGNIGYSANIVCNTVKVSGNANFNITYKEEQNFRMPPMIELAQ